MAKSSKKSKQSKNKKTKALPKVQFGLNANGDKVAQAIWRAGVGAFLSAEESSDWQAFTDYVAHGKSAEVALLQKLDSKKGLDQIKKAIRAGKKALKTPAKSADGTKPLQKGSKSKTGADSRGRLSMAKGEPDDLTQIRGVGPALQTRLQELGVFHLWQIAQLSDPQLVDLEAEIGARAGLTRNDWRAQAAALHSVT